MKKSKSQVNTATTPEERICDHLIFLYGEAQFQAIWPDLITLMETFSLDFDPAISQKSGGIGSIAAPDAILITYGDQFQDPDRTALQSLHAFLKTNLPNEIEAVHILPFYPYSSDDGFSVIDFRQVDPKLGTWEDIATLSQDYDLMFDAVINHISRHSPWFKAFLRGEAPYKDYFISIDPDTDLSTVIRPRTSPLLTQFETAGGSKHVWTTFSDDQIDLNFANPQVLLEMIDLLLFYIKRGACIIRLDAIAFAWKEIGTACIHLPQTHRIVKILREVLDLLAPGVILITETNVPHEENISYFGDPLPVADGDTQPAAGDQAHMVYQFPLAPLVLHTFYSEDASILTRWAADLELPYSNTTYFNFIASHDGIGIRPAEGLLSDDQIQVLVETTQTHGGQISSRTKLDGSTSVYELNITLYNALNDPNNPQPETDIQRFMASQVIMLSLAGVPGIYIHSLFGSRNCQACVAKTGRARSINREKFQRADIETLLSNPENHQSQVFGRYKQLLSVRRQHPAFKHNSLQMVLCLHKRLFAIRRATPDNSHKVLCLVNVSNQPLTLYLPLADVGMPESGSFTDLISARAYQPTNGSLHLELQSYQSLWITPAAQPAS
jgi:glucosylglycerate phosphorylase